MGKPELPPGPWDKDAIAELRDDARWAYLDGRNARARELNRRADALARWVAKELARKSGKTSLRPVAKRRAVKSAA